MCNYSKGVYNDGMERGRNTGIAGAADILKRMGMDAGKIVEQLMLQYGLGREEAAGYVHPIIKRAMLIVITFLVTDNRLKNLYIGFI